MVPSFRKWRQRNSGKNIIPLAKWLRYSSFQSVIFTAIDRNQSVRESRIRLPVLSYVIRHSILATTYLEIEWFAESIPNEVEKRRKTRSQQISCYSPIGKDEVWTTEYTELQRLLSGVHSIMRVKLAQAGKGGGCTPTPFHYIYHHQ